MMLESENRPIMVTLKEKFHVIKNSLKKLFKDRKRHQKKVKLRIRKGFIRVEYLIYNTLSHIALMMKEGRNVLIHFTSIFSASTQASE